MRFITDGMLGKLTRWLRLLGFDVEYANAMEDQKLMTTAKIEKRILLTRDLELFQQANTRGIDVLLVEGRTEAERLVCMAKKYGLTLDVDVKVSRCPKCNTQIKPVSKDSVLDKVKEATFMHYDEFWQCPNCGQIYWQGAHWKKITTTLDEAKTMLGSVNQCSDLK